MTFRYLPYSILDDFDFYLDEFRSQLIVLHPYLVYRGEDAEENPYYLLKHNGHYLSNVGVGPALLLLPVVFIPIKFFGLSAESGTIIFLAKLTASMLVAFSALAILFSLRKLTTENIALLITFIYAFCSGMWSITGQVLTQQTASEFFLAFIILFLVKGLKNPSRIPFVGFLAASSIIMRPTNVIVILVLTIYVIFQYKEKLPLYLLYAVLPISFVLYYNYQHHGSVFLFPQAVYNPIGAVYKTGSANMWSTPLYVGLLGTLLSPSRGLLVHSPVFIFSFLGIALVWGNKKGTLFKYISAIVIILVIVHSKWYDWWGGWTFGCRVLNDAVPLLALLLLPAFDYIKKHRWLFSVFIITIIISFFIQAIGAFFFDNSWNSSPNIDLNQYRLWSWKDSQLLYYVRSICRNIWAMAR